MCAAPAGRFWAGSMAYDGMRGTGSLYRTDLDGRVVRVLDGLTIVNGPAFTADGTTVYFADTAAGTIFRCRVDPGPGDLSDGPEVFARLRQGEGGPDGMTVDAEDCLWVRHMGCGNGPPLPSRRPVAHHPDGARPAPHVGVPAPRRPPPLRHHGPLRGDEPDRCLGRGAQRLRTGRRGDRLLLAGPDPIVGRLGRTPAGRVTNLPEQHT